MKKIPVILDTDIGTDIDDTWALIMLLKCPELDLKLVTVATDDTPYRARIVAKILEIAGRTDIPIGIGPRQKENAGPQNPWVYDYNLSSYSGTIIEDGVSAIVDVIMKSPEQMTLIAIGPLINVAQALEREPRITENSRFVGMHGSIYKGYDGNAKPHKEYNVMRDPKSCKKVFEAPWEVTITPLDTCGIVTLDGERYKRVRDSEDPLIEALIENYETWAFLNRRYDPRKETSVLFDTVAIYLAFSEELLGMETLGIKVRIMGSTVVRENAKKIRCATTWKDLDKFKELLVDILCSNP
ncbi:MAG: nucleoside hydrolase [Candidatus Hodarchaeota archaeon]